MAEAADRDSDPARRFADGGGTGRQGFVDGVFARVAKRYDLMNDLMSGGVHRLWKDALVTKLSPPRALPARYLDLAGGTGDVAFRILDRASRAHVTLADINPAMLTVGQDRAEKNGIAGR